MKHLLFMLESLFREQERIQGDTEYLGFEAYTRPTEMDASSETSAPVDAVDKELRKAA